MDRFPQPPDEPDDGNCRRCKRWITRNELLIDGCTECDDLLMDDMRKLWAGRPKDKPLSRIKCPIYIFSFDPDSGYVELSGRRYDWRGLI